MMIDVLLAIRCFRLDDGVEMKGVGVCLSSGTGRLVIESTAQHLLSHRADSSLDGWSRTISGAQTTTSFSRRRRGLGRGGEWSAADDRSGRGGGDDTSWRGEIRRGEWWGDGSWLVVRRVVSTMMMEDGGGTTNLGAESD